MSRIMADAVVSANIPVGKFKLVAGYLNGAISKWSQADWDRHAGHSILVKITVFASLNDGHMLDVETGDATPAQAPGWVRMRRAAGFLYPTIYCSESIWSTVKAEFNRQGVAQPSYVVAAYPGEHDASGNPLIPDGAIGHQYADPATSGGQYDLSVVADYWPGVDPGGKVALNQDDANGLSTTQWSITISKTDPLSAYLKTVGYTADAAGNILVVVPFGQLTLYNFLRIAQLTNATSGVLSQIAALSTKLDSLTAAETKTDTDVLAAQTEEDSRLGAIADAIRALPPESSGSSPTDAQMADLETKLIAAFPNYSISFTKV